MKTKEEIISIIESIKGLDIALTIDDSNAVIHYLSKLNPNRIDEERFMSIVKGSRQSVEEDMKEYNSTLPEPLVRLPEEMPEEFSKKINELAHGFPVLIAEIWSWVVNTYGTPQKELPSVEELLAEIYDLKWNRLTPDECKRLAQHLIAKYKLDAKKEEWWMKLKKGDKFMWKGQIKTFRNHEVEHKLFIDVFPSMIYCPAQECHPYTEPSIHDIARQKLGDEDYERLMEEVRG